MSTKLTTRQQEILAVIEEAVNQHGRPPTLREISTHFGFASPNAARDHLKALETKGLIALEDGARGIRLLNQPFEDAVEMIAPEAGLPLIGRVAAGAPILAEEHVEAHIPVDPAIFGRADYLLRVYGESMQEGGILNGDLVAVRRTMTAENGQIVVARIGDEVTVKKLKKEGTTIALHPQNRLYQVINVDPSKDSFIIEGVVVGVIRTSMDRQVHH